MFDSIIFGAAAIALIVGAFSIVNTMTIAVAERTREIGIRKAIGAGDGDILREFLVEASAIGAFGGAIGLPPGPYWWPSSTRATPCTAISSCLR